MCERDLENRWDARESSLRWKRDFKKKTKAETKEVSACPSSLSSKSVVVNSMREEVLYKWETEREWETERLRRKVKERRFFT